MPIYEYYCPECSWQCERLVSHAKADQVPCPQCEYPTMERMLSTFATRSSSGSEESTPAQTPHAAPHPAATMDHCAYAWQSPSSGTKEST